LSERQLETLARAGVAWVQPGIEALCDETLRLMRKGVSALLNIRTLRNCRELGIGVVWNVLHGFPGESSSGYRGMASLLPMLEHLQPPTGCRKLRIDRFSPNFNQAAELGFSDVRPASAYAAIFNLPDRALENMAYFFEGTGFPLADDESIRQVMAGVQRWHAAWFRAASVPSLHSHDVSPGLLVFDTRRVAVKAMHYLGADEATVLKCLREPTAMQDIETRGIGELPARRCKSVLQELIAQRLVLEIDGVALSLLTEAERSIYNAAAPADFPLGYVIAGDRPEVATHADEAVLLPAD
jgi:magnesium-protoporphyrin IX monomethyl ester (oxidative) cyclase